LEEFVIGGSAFLMDEVKVNEFFGRLGLTEYEAKTLNALFRSREAGAPEIGRMAEVPKTRVYDILEKLARKNLVIEIQGRPKKYRAVEAENVVRELIEGKRREVKELEEKSNELKNFLYSLGKGKEVSEERVMKVKSREDFEKILAQEVVKARNCVDGFTEIRNEHEALREALHYVKKKGINVRLIGKVSKETKRLSEQFNSKGIKTRHLEHGINAFLIDEKKVLLGISDFGKDKPEYHFTIWQDNPAMAKLFGSYFNECWQKGKSL